MKEGRMKGQAFIGLPNEKAAAKALKEANGYVLFGKPMVVVSFKQSVPKTMCLLSRRVYFQLIFMLLLRSLNTWHSSSRYSVTNILS